MKKNIDLKQIANNFNFEGDFIRANHFGDGHINETYKVEYHANSGKINYILQKINEKVFTKPFELMENISKITKHLNDKTSNINLEIIKTKCNKDIYFANDEYWRAYKFIDNTIAYNSVDDLELLEEIGRTFGSFQKDLCDFPANELVDTIEDFHNTKKRYVDLIHVLEKDELKKRTNIIDEVNIAIGKSVYCSLIIDSIEKEEIPLRVTHNDTKLNNVLIDKDSKKGVCVIDLDTVMKGSLLYDYGDSIRSCSSTALEDEENLELVKIDLDRFKAFTTGFLSRVGELTKKEIELLPYAPIIMTYECGIRFLKDYLEGDIYFKVHFENHNLIRARNQLKLVSDMEKNLDEMKKIVNDCIERINIW